MRTGLLAACVLAFLSAGLIGCHRAPDAPTQLPQRGYLWQREWTPAVIEAVRLADRKMDGIVLLGAEVHWKGRVPQIIRSSVSWDALKSASNPCAIALRIAPFPGPFAADDVPARALKEASADLLNEARAHGVHVVEFQIDFDCAQKKLAGYRIWVAALRPVVGKTPLVITSLPAWLGEPEFLPLLRETDGYVLQVHSVPTEKESGHADLCDSNLARKWVAHAENLRVPFSVALPTYWCLAGYDASHKLLGVSMDSVQPSWPAGTRVLEFFTEADAVACLVKEWQAIRPKGMKGIIWYRVPVSTDARNWGWTTLSAVMDGRKPARRLEAIAEGDNPVDVSLVNFGEADDSLDRTVIASWDDGDLVSADAHSGWTVKTEHQRALFIPQPGRRLRLSPGGQRGIGWLRYDKITRVHLQLADSQATPR